MSEITFFENTFLSADGHSRVHYCIWKPEGVTPRGIIQLSHGMCEYVKRYDAWARRFAKAGFVFCGNDHLGHGNTAPDESELGYTAHRGGAELLVEDVHTMTRLIKAEYPDLPLILYGHSMGSFVARAYLTRYGGELTAAIISGTGGPEQPTGLGRRFAHLIAAMRGDHHRSKLLTALAFGSYNKRFREESSTFSWLTRDAEERKSYGADVFCRFIFTAAGYDTLFSLLHTVSRREWAASVPQELPMLLVSGDMDPVGNYGKGVRTVYERLLDAGCTRVSLKLYEGARHEPHHETNRDEVFADLMDFIKGALG